MSDQPERFCDLVMKGGITSGIVYPKAVCELAKQFSFRSIGGTSAGAIAAAVSAAAEHGRRKGLDSFRKLEGLPEILGGTGAGGKGSFLFTLFQPQPRFARLFRVLTGMLGAKRPAWALVSGLARNYWLATGLSLLTGALFFRALVPNAQGWQLAAAALAVIVVFAATFILAIALLVRGDCKKLRGNLFGFCTGMPNPKIGGDSLTPWLDALINDYAGKPGTEPLTFGDLWENTEAGGEKRVCLEMMTTCLTHGRPYRLPFDQHIFYFREEEFRQLFPAGAVDWMVAHPSAASDRYEGFVAMPDAANLPVIVATRMSLSFPILFSAIPLYAVDFSRADVPRKPEVCWFSDGGICNNFPVQLFDSPLPRWPTFAINLLPWDPLRNEEQSRVVAKGGTPPEPEMVYLPGRNQGGILEAWNRFDLSADGHPKGGLGAVTGFVGSILNAMQNWVDNRQIRIPGYRDRVAHVYLKPEEGGLNLNMPASVIEAVSARGGEAGRQLSDRFRVGSTHPMNWDNHRWVRFRSTMAGLEEFLTKILRGYTDTVSARPFRSYEQLIDRTSKEDPASYRFDDDQRAFAKVAIAELLKVGADWTRESRLGEGAPRPQPELRMMPRLGTKGDEGE